MIRRNKISEYLNAEVPDTEALINYILKTNGGTASVYRADAMLI